MTLIPFPRIGKRLAGETASLLKPVHTRIATRAAGICTRALAALSLCLLFASVITIQGTQQAFAAPAIPAVQAQAHTNWSFYINTSSTDTAKNRGCGQGKADATHHDNSLVILDFGAQAGDGSGAFFPGTSTFISNSQIEAVAESFSANYVSCAHQDGDTTTSLWLGIGTNNSGSNVGSTNGTTWAHVVAAVASFNRSFGFSSQVKAYGANDIESWCGSSVGCKSPSSAISWAKGYSSVSGSLYFNFGSADECPTSGYNDESCGSTGWTQYDYWYLSWGNPAALPTPEIYHDSWASQWEMIDLYSVNHQGGRMTFEGPMDEYDLDNSTDTAAQAWDALWSALNSHSSTAQNLFYSIEIHRE